MAMATVHEVIGAFRHAPSNSERGTKFEKLMVRYFELDPMLASTYDRVWRWIDWPDRKGKADTGIDLVARADVWRVTKMRWRSKVDHSAIVYSPHLTITGIPDEAHEYRLGSRTALEWLIDRYRLATDKPSDYKRS